MYKSIPAGLEKKNLDSDLYKLHKTGKGKSDFGMDNTSSLLENGFGLYSTSDLKRKIGPVKTQYFRISLTRKGSADFDIGLEKYSTKRNSILFGIPGQVFSLNNYSRNFLAYYMLFSENFIADVFIRLDNKQNFPFLNYTGLQCFELDNETAMEVENIIFRMDLEIKENKPGCSEMIKLYIQQILLLANRCYGSVVLSTNNTSNALKTLYNDFLRLVGKHFLSVRKVSAYAKMLHVSPDHLNRAIKSCSDKTASELINEMIILEAKAYLLHTSITVSEIAYKFDFTDPSHFNRFFKSQCKMTPAEFRNQS